MGTEGVLVKAAALGLGWALTLLAAAAATDFNLLSGVALLAALGLAHHRRPSASEANLSVSKDG